ncbi:MAG: hypothetical protein IPH60_15240 [Flavobacteriales bacterium]|nr:hypothetical protein [Flavobacteriales bacterium]
MDREHRSACRSEHHTAGEPSVQHPVCGDYDYTPTTVYVGYTPGYLGSYVQNGVVIYGTGYYYRPWPGCWYP